MRLHLLLLLLTVSCASLSKGKPVIPAELSWSAVEVEVLEDAGLRGLSLPQADVVWISGARGLCVMSANGGETWRDVSPEIAREEALDLRSLHAFDAQRAIAVSAGPGKASRILRTTDGGRSWETVHTNRDPDGFFDSVAFWDDRRGLCFGDPTDGRLTLLVTSDGGSTWTRVPAERMPAAIEGEAGFAASNGCVALAPGGFGWIGTGGASARVHRTEDFGANWSAVRSPLRSGGEATGIFAVSFDGRDNGICVGGEYTDPANELQNCALSHDGGQTWLPPVAPPRGYRSSVARMTGTRAGWIAVGITGTDVSADGGERWGRIGGGSDLELNAVRVSPGKDVAWAVGPNGRVLRMALR